MKTTHKQKVKIARKLLTKVEKKIKVPKFQSAGWEKRKLAIKLKVNKKIQCSIAKKQKRNQKLKK